MAAAAAAAALGPMAGALGMANMVGHLPPVLGPPVTGGKTPLLPLPGLPPITLSPMQSLVQDPRAKADPRLSRDPRQQANAGGAMTSAMGVDHRAPMDGYQQRMAPPAMGGGGSGIASMNDPRRAGGFSGPRQQQVDPRQTPRAATDSRPFNGPRASGPTGAQEQNSPSSEPRRKMDPRANRADPRQKRDPRANKDSSANIVKEYEQPPNNADEAGGTRKMTYSSPLSAYDDGATGGSGGGGGGGGHESAYTRRSIGRIKKKNQGAKSAGAQAAESSITSPPSTEQTSDSEKAATTTSGDAPVSAPAAVTDVGTAALPPPPSLLSHPVDPYASTDDKPLSEMFKTKDPTASPFN